MEMTRECLYTEALHHLSLPPSLPPSLPFSLPPHLCRAGVVSEAVEVKQGEGRRALPCLSVGE